MVRFGLQLLLASLALNAGAADEGRVIDRVVAVVGGGNAERSSVQSTVITFWKLEFEARLAIIRLTEGRTTVATATLDLDTLRTTLGYLIGQQLAFDQATLQKLGSVNEDQVTAELDKLAADLGGPGKLQVFLARNQVTADDVKEILRRDLIVDQFMASKVSLEARLSTADIEKYAKDHAQEFQLFADPAERLEHAGVGASSERDAKLKRTVLRQLYARAKVRIVDPEFGGADAAFQSPDDGARL